ncbi:MAG: DUF4142 domain-containing protein [Janthinobacterium lividum]
MKFTRLASLLLLTGAAAAFAGGTLAQTAANATVAGKDVMASKSLSSDDREFMIKAAGNNLYEIEVSKLAAEKSQNAEIKRYAATLVRDHTAAKEELRTIAVAKPLRIPDDMPDGKKVQLKMFADATPAEFDEKYLKMVGLEEHRTDIELFETQVEKGKDAQLKAFVAKTLPKLKMHLVAAEKLVAGGVSPAAAK